VLPDTRPARVQTSYYPGEAGPPQEPFTIRLISGNPLDHLSLTGLGTKQIAALTHEWQDGIARGGPGREWAKPARYG